MGYGRPIDLFIEYNSYDSPIALIESLEVGCPQSGHHIISAITFFSDQNGVSCVLLSNKYSLKFDLRLFFFTKLNTNEFLNLIRLKMELLKRWGGEEYKLESSDLIELEFVS